MPLVKRAVEPSALCRQSLPRNVKSELECVTNNTLSGVIKQLSSLSIHAEDLFGELFTEASTFYTRASKLQDRIDKLSVKVTQLDSSIEEVSLHDINMRKAFRSNRITDQQVVSRESLSQTLHATYNKADKPPPLQDLNQFRDDGRDALKIYTDPDYFFNLWREAMQKEMRDAKEKRREQRKKEKKTNPVRKQGEVRKAIPKSRLKAQQMQQGVEFINTPVRNHVDPTPVKSVQSNTSSPSMSSTKSPDMSVSPDGYGSPQVHHPSPPPPPKMADGPTQHYVSPMTDLPAPPPPPTP
ncbi:unnamed protein product [Clavelina lepadiformis]|uniref:Wiskott-Aldrich syndrome protein family member n=1 Tax=Clavelina lepadiformis TaxID=159417 RepID=A0ABP0GCH0_CLALP